MANPARLVVATIAIAVTVGAGTVGAQTVAGGPLVWFEGHGYEQVVVPGGTDWFQAYRAAMEHTNGGMRGHLATITSAEEDIVVRTVVGVGTYWLGGFQPRGSIEPWGGWTWVTGEAWGLGDWVPGEPNNAGGNEDGVEFVGQRGWNDAPRTTILDGYIVEYEAPRATTLDVSESAVVIDPASGRGYQRVEVPVGIDWAHARDEAARRRTVVGSGQLAGITTESQQATIHGLVGNRNCWIGGYQPAGSAEPAEGWQWLTGERVALNHWAAGEPNNANGNEDVMEMYPSGEWNDNARSTVLTCYVAMYAPAVASPPVTIPGPYEERPWR